MQLIINCIQFDNNKRKQNRASATTHMRYYASEETSSNDFFFFERFLFPEAVLSPVRTDSTVAFIIFFLQDKGLTPFFFRFFFTSSFPMTASFRALSFLISASSFSQPAFVASEIWKTQNKSNCAISTMKTHVIQQNRFELDVHDRRSNDISQLVCQIIVLSRNDIFRLSTCSSSRQMSQTIRCGFRSLVSTFCYLELLRDDQSSVEKRSELLKLIENATGCHKMGFFSKVLRNLFCQVELFLESCIAKSSVNENTVGRHIFVIVFVERQKTIRSFESLHLHRLCFFEIFRDTLN